jgi:hypothetical protein
VIPSTTKKLREARFFMAKLEHETTPLDPSHTEEAEFYFSAFLSAARSVTFVLKAEELEKYAAWSPGWLASRSAREQSLLRRFTNARNRALKCKTPPVAEDRAESMLDPYAGLPPELRFSLMDEEHKIPGYRSLKCRLMPEDAEEEVVPLCREYESLLTALVQAFMAEHT